MVSRLSLCIREGSGYVGKERLHGSLSNAVVLFAVINKRKALNYRDNKNLARAAIQPFLDPTIPLLYLHQPHILALFDPTQSPLPAAVSISKSLSDMNTA